MISGYRNSYLIYDIETGKVERIFRSSDKQQDDDSKESKEVIDITLEGSNNNVDVILNQNFDPVYLYDRHGKLKQIGSKRSGQCLNKKI